MATPFLKPLRVQGGTFFTFASAAKDISKTFTDDNARFVFSKYALLKLPEARIPQNQDNSVVWQALNAFGGGATATDPDAVNINADSNFNFSQVFQSYALNFEQLVLDSQNNFNETYDETILPTASERIFWHFLKNLNAIRWDNANTVNESTIPERYKEEFSGATASTGYESVVKYLGDIDVINNISRGGQSYSEIYIHVPTSHGNTPLVLFKTEEDQNYRANEVWESATNTLYGRDTTGSSTPFGLFNDGYFDDYSNNQYILGPTFGNVTNVGTTAYNAAGTPIPVLISSMDGVKLDFNPESYYPIANNAELTSIDDFNASAQSSDFEFNICLVYYDSYDVSNPDNFARNLYGVLVIDDYENGITESGLKNFTKFKPNPVTKLNGNSYGLKLNLKFDTQNDNVGVETVIREDLTFGMDLFADASVRLQESADMFIDQKVELINMQRQITDLQQYYFSQDTIDLLTARVDSLESGLNNAQLNFEDETTILDLIRQNSDNINDILTGQVNVQLTYNTNVIQPGPGIIVDQSVPNQVSIENKVQGYYTFNQCLNSSGHLAYGPTAGSDPFSTTEGNRIVLGEYTNYFRNIGATAPDILGSIDINIDDTNHKWRTGQTLRISFADDINIDTHTINIKTDAQNTKGLGNYGVLVGSLTIADLVTTKPIIEIICVDQSTYSFYIDVVK
jgi:hypothetical protein